jgi:hypothetical protein
MADSKSALQGLLSRGIKGVADDMQAAEEDADAPKAVVPTKLELSIHHRKLKSLSVGQLEFAICHSNVGLSMPNLKKLGQGGAMMNSLRGKMFNRHTKKKAQKHEELDAALKTRRLAKVKQDMTSSYKTRLLIIAAVITGLGVDDQFRSRDGPGMSETTKKWSTHWEKNRKKVCPS